MSCHEVDKQTSMQGSGAVKLARIKKRHVWWVPGPPCCWEPSASCCEVSLSTPSYMLQYNSVSTHVLMLYHHFTECGYQFVQILALMKTFCATRYMSYVLYINYFIEQGNMARHGVKKSLQSAPELPSAEYHWVNREVNFSKSIKSIGLASVLDGRACHYTDSFRQTKLNACDNVDNVTMCMWQCRQYTCICLQKSNLWAKQL